MGPFEIAAIAIIGGLGYAAYETHMKTKGKAGKADIEALQAAYFHAWRSLNNIQADQLITSMPITQ